MKNMIWKLVLLVSVPSVHAKGFLQKKDIDAEKEDDGNFLQNRQDAWGRIASSHSPTRWGRIASSHSPTTDWNTNANRVGRDSRVATFQKELQERETELQERETELEQHKTKLQTAQGQELKELEWEKWEKEARVAQAKIERNKAKKLVDNAQAKMR